MEAFDNKTPLLGDARQVARKNGGLTGNAGSDTPVIVVNLDKNCVLQIDATSVSWTTTTGDLVVVNFDRIIGARVKRCVRERTYAPTTGDDTVLSPKISSDFGTSAGADAKSGQVSDDVKREVSSFRKFISKVFPKKRAKRFKNGQLPPGGTVRVMVDTLVIAEVRPIKSKLAQLGLAKENKVKKEVIYHHLHLDPTYELIDISMLLAEKRGGFGQSLRRTDSFFPDGFSATGVSSLQSPHGSHTPAGPPMTPSNRLPRLYSAQMSSALSLRDDMDAQSTANSTPTFFTLLVRRLVRVIRILAVGSASRTRCVRVILNPHSGHGKGIKVWRQKLAPLLLYGGMRAVVSYTRKAGDAIEFGINFNPSLYEGVIFFGGDGTVQEFVSGLLSQPTWRSTVRRVPLCPVACGTASALAVGLRLTDPAHIAYCLIKRKLRPLDAILVSNGAGLRTVAMCGVGWGIPANIAYSSEAFRFLGTARYAYLSIKYGLELFFGISKHRALLEYSADMGMDDFSLSLYFSTSKQLQGLSRRKGLNNTDASPTRVEYEKIKMLERRNRVLEPLTFAEAMAPPGAQERAEWERRRDPINNNPATTVYPHLTEAQTYEARAEILNTLFQIANKVAHGKRGSSMDSFTEGQHHLLDILTERAMPTGPRSIMDFQKSSFNSVTAMDPLYPTEAPPFSRVIVSPDEEAVVSYGGTLPKGMQFHGLVKNAVEAFKSNEPDEIGTGARSYSDARVAPITVSSVPGAPPGISISFAQQQEEIAPSLATSMVPGITTLTDRTRPAGIPPTPGGASDGTGSQRSVPGLVRRPSLRPLSIPPAHPDIQSVPVAERRSSIPFPPKAISPSNDASQFLIPTVGKPALIPCKVNCDICIENGKLRYIGHRTCNVQLDIPQETEHPLLAGLPQVSQWPYNHGQTAVAALKPSTQQLVPGASPYVPPTSSAGQPSLPLRSSVNSGQKPGNSSEDTPPRPGTLPAGAYDYTSGGAEHHTALISPGRPTLDLAGQGYSSSVLRPVFPGMEAPLSPLRNPNVTGVFDVSSPTYDDSDLVYRTYMCGGGWSTPIPRLTNAVTWKTIFASLAPGGNKSDSGTQPDTGSPVLYESPIARALKAPPDQVVNRVTYTPSQLHPYAAMHGQRRFWPAPAAEQKPVLDLSQPSMAAIAKPGLAPLLSMNSAVTPASSAPSSTWVDIPPSLDTKISGINIYAPPGATPTPSPPPLDLQLIQSPSSGAVNYLAPNALVAPAAGTSAGTSATLPAPMSRFPSSYSLPPQSAAAATSQISASSALPVSTAVGTPQSKRPHGEPMLSAHNSFYYSTPKPGVTWEGDSRASFTGEVDMQSVFNEAFPPKEQLLPEDLVLWEYEKLREDLMYHPDEDEWGEEEEGNIEIDIVETGVGVPVAGGVTEKDRLQPPTYPPQVDILVDQVSRPQVFTAEPSPYPAGASPSLYSNLSTSLNLDTEGFRPDPSILHSNRELVYQGLDKKTVERRLRMQERNLAAFERKRKKILQHEEEERERRLYRERKYAQPAAHSYSHSVASPSPLRSPRPIRPPVRPSSGLASGHVTPSASTPMPMTPKSPISASAPEHKFMLGSLPSVLSRSLRKKFEEKKRRKSWSTEQMELWTRRDMAAAASTRDVTGKAPVRVSGSLDEPALGPPTSVILEATSAPELAAASAAEDSARGEPSTTDDRTRLYSGGLVQILPPAAALREYDKEVILQALEEAEKQEEAESADMGQEVHSIVTNPLIEHPLGLQEDQLQPSEEAQDKSREEPATATESRLANAPGIAQATASASAPGFVPIGSVPDVSDHPQGQLQIRAPSAQAPLPGATKPLLPPRAPAGKRSAIAPTLPSVIRNKLIGKTDRGYGIYRERGSFVTVAALTAGKDGKFVHCSDGYFDVVLAREGSFAETVGLISRYVGRLALCGISDELNSSMFEYVKARCMVLIPEGEESGDEEEDIQDTLNVPPELKLKPVIQSPTYETLAASRPPPPSMSFGQRLRKVFSHTVAAEPPNVQALNALPVELGGHAQPGTSAASTAPLHPPAASGRPPMAPGLAGNATNAPTAPGTNPGNTVPGIAMPPTSAQNSTALPGAGGGGQTPPFLKPKKKKPKKKKVSCCNVDGEVLPGPGPFVFHLLPSLLTAYGEY